MSGRLTKRSKEPGIILLRGADPYSWRRKQIVFGEIREGRAVPPPCTCFRFAVAGTVTFWFGDKNKDECWRATGVIVVIPANLSKWTEAL